MELTPDKTVRFTNVVSLAEPRLRQRGRDCKSRKPIDSAGHPYGFAPPVPLCRSSVLACHCAIPALKVIRVN